MATEFFARWKDRRKLIELTPKPKELPEGAVDQRSWQQYQTYLSRIHPVARADFYRRLMESQGLKSIRALAKVTGEGSAAPSDARAIVLRRIAPSLTAKP